MGEQRPRPALAEKWEPDAAAKNWTSTLRQGVTFQHGKPFGADDVVATMDILLDPDTVSAALSNFQRILSKGGVEKVIDRLTGRMSSGRPYSETEAVGLARGEGDLDDNATFFIDREVRRSMTRH